MRKYLYILIVVIIAIAVFFFPVKAEPTKITLLMQALEVEQWQPILARFREKYPEINLEIIEAPNATNQLEDLYTSSFLLGKSPYDLVYMDVIWVSKFAAAGWLKPLNQWVIPENLREFLPKDIEAGIYQNQLYRIPLRSDVGMLYYRTDLLAQIQALPPTTYQELIEISQELQQKQLVKWGYLWQGKQYEGLSAMFVEILTGYGGFWIDPSTLQVGLDSSEAIQAVNFLIETINSGISPPGVTTYQEEETRFLFQSGQGAFLRNWPYVYGLASDSPIEGNYAIKTMVHQPPHPSGACLGGWGLGIASSSQHPDEAWKVIEFLSAPQQQKEFILATGYVPSRTKLFTDAEIVAKYPHYPKLLEVIQNATLRPYIPQYAQASDILQRYLSAALTERMTPESALNAAAKETRLLLSR